MNHPSLGNKKNVAPGPRGLAKMMGFFRFRNDPEGYLRELASSFGRTANLVAFNLFTPAFLLLNPELVHRVLVKEPERDKYQPIALGMKRLAELVGWGVLTSRGPAWKSMRDTMNPQFRGSSLQETAVIMKRCVNATVTEWERLAERGENLNMSEAMERFTLQILGECILGVNFSDELKQIGEATDRGLEAIFPGMHDPFTLRWLPTSANRSLAAAKRTLNTVSRRLIVAEKVKLGHGEQRPNLISTLLQAGMTDEAVLDNIKTFMLAGHETTGIALTWLWYLLARRPEWMERLGKEARASKSYREMRLISATVKETMRLFPTAWLMGREVVAEDTLDGYRIPKRSIVLIPIFLLGTDERWWDKPLEFNPERFLDGSVKHKLAHMPFGSGPRICIGKEFAETEMALLVAETAKRVRFELADRHFSPTPQIGFTRKPTEPIWLRIRKL